MIIFFNIINNTSCGNSLREAMPTFQTTNLGSLICKSVSCCQRTYYNFNISYFKSNPPMMGRVASCYLLAPYALHSWYCNKALLGTRERSPSRSHLRIVGRNDHRFHSRVLHGLPLLPPIGEEC